MYDAINEGIKPQTQITLIIPLVHLKKEQIVSESVKFGLVIKMKIRLAWFVLVVDCALMDLKSRD